MNVFEIPEIVKNIIGFIDVPQDYLNLPLINRTFYKLTKNIISEMNMICEPRKDKKNNLISKEFANLADKFKFMIRIENTIYSISNANKFFSLKLKNIDVNQKTKCFFTFDFFCKYACCINYTENYWNGLHKCNNKKIKFLSSILGKVLRISLVVSTNYLLNEKYENIETSYRMLMCYVNLPQIYTEENYIAKVIKHKKYKCNCIIFYGNLLNGKDIMNYRKFNEFEMDILEYYILPKINEMFENIANYQKSDEPKMCILTYYLSVNINKNTSALASIVYEILNLAERKYVDPTRFLERYIQYFDNYDFLIVFDHSLMYHCFAGRYMSIHVETMRSWIKKYLIKYTDKFESLLEYD